MSGNGNGRGLVTAMQDAMMGEPIVQRDVFVGRVMALRPSAGASIRDNMFKRGRLIQAGLTKVSIGDDSYVVQGGVEAVSKAIHKALAGMGAVWAKEQAQKALDEAYKAQEDANQAVKFAEANATRVGL